MENWLTFEKASHFSRVSCFGPKCLTLETWLNVKSKPISNNFGILAQNILLLKIGWVTNGIVKYKIWFHVMLAQTFENILLLRVSHFSKVSQLVSKYILLRNHLLLRICHFLKVHLDQTWERGWKLESVFFWWPIHVHSDERMMKTNHTSTYINNRAYVNN